MPIKRRSTTRACLTAAAALALVAAGVSAYLSWLAIGHGQSALGCTGTTFGCDEVLGSPWSVALGLPVSLLGAALYAVMLVILLLLVFAPGQRFDKWLRMPLIAAATMAVGAAVWFISLQTFELRAFCPYCLAVHACGAALAVLVFLGLPRVRSRADNSTRRALLMVSQPSRSSNTLPIVPTDSARHAEVGIAIGIGLLVILVAAQIVFPPASYQEEQFSDVARAAEDPPPATGASTSTPSASEAPMAAREDAATPTAEEETADAADAAVQRDDATATTGVQSAGSEDTVLIEEDVASLFPDPVEPSTERAEDQNVQPADGERKLRLLGGKLILNMKDHKLIGSPDAPHVMVKLFDYTCPHCQKLHTELEKARQRYGDQLAIVLINVPLNARCNPLVVYTHPQHRSACLIARLADAVWRERPDRFEEFHQWMFDGERSRPAGDVRRYVEQLLGDETFNAAMADPAYHERLEQCVAIYDVCKQGALPKMILDDALITGTPKQLDQLYELIERYLSLRPIPP